MVQWGAIDEALGESLDSMVEEGLTLEEAAKYMKEYAEAFLR